MGHQKIDPYFNSSNSLTCHLFSQQFQYFFFKESHLISHLFIYLDYFIGKVSKPEYLSLARMESIMAILTAQIPSHYHCYSSFFSYSHLYHPQVYWTYPFYSFNWAILLHILFHHSVQAADFSQEGICYLQRDSVHSYATGCGDTLDFSRCRLVEYAWVTGTWQALHQDTWFYSLYTRSKFEQLLCHSSPRIQRP